MKSVTKMTDNLGGGKAGTPSATTDKVFLLSMTEVYGDLQSDGAQYEYYKSKGMTTSNYSSASSSSYHWTRSVHPSNSASFRCVHSNGSYDYYSATNIYCVFPAFCFIASSATNEKPVRFCAGFSFGNQTNDSRLEA